MHAGLGSDTSHNVYYVKLLIERDSGQRPKNPFKRPPWAPYRQTDQAEILPEFPSTAPIKGFAHTDRNHFSRWSSGVRTRHALNLPAPEIANKLISCL